MSNTQLTIHISRTSVHVAEVLRSNREMIRSEYAPLHESTPQDYKEKLKAFIDQHGFDKDYEEVTAAWSSANYALIPLRVFNESNPKSIHALLFGDKVKEQTVDFNRLMELNMVNVFEIPDWVKSFFVMRYPRITIKHEHGMFLRALFQNSTFDRAIHVSLCDDYMNISIVHHNELIFSNSFHYQTADDVLYYTLFSLEQKGLQKEKVKLSGYYVCEEQAKILSEYKTLLSKVASASSIDTLPFINSLTLQPLCV